MLGKWALAMKGCQFVQLRQNRRMSPKKVLLKVKK